MASTIMPPAIRTSHPLASHHLPSVLGSRPEEASSQTAGSTAIPFFSLPLEVRNGVYSRVLIIPHPVFLFQDTGSRIETFAPDKPLRWLALLYIDRQMHIEATAILYRLNVFNFVDATRKQAELLQNFTSCIGSVNAGLLSYLCIRLMIDELPFSVP